tara:strand:- start:493 stop:807 length:315 start_codon:yes stop_codon:yes gene_type:complete
MRYEEPSYDPCPMCGKSDEVDERELSQNLEDARKAVNNLKFLNLGFGLGYYMTDLERKVYYFHQIRKDSFKEMSEIFNKSEGTLRSAWNRCKSKGIKVLEDSMI